MMNKLFRKKNIGRIIIDAEKDFWEQEHSGSLKRSLKVRDLAAFGIAAIVGAGIFSTIGNAAANGGPAVSLLFIFTAIACAFSALCYAQFASSIPVAGSAYTYAYVAFGELIAWIIGWDLLLEYAIGNIVVAISWSDYFTGLMDSVGLHFPEWMCTDVVSAFKGNNKVLDLLAHGKSLESLSAGLQESYKAWQGAPTIGGLHLVLDVPAFAIVIFITWLVYTGIKESRNATNLMVGLKLLAVLFVIIVGAFYVKTENWHPFAPHGLAGVMKGVSAVFFAYIGFDAISTTAEECENPNKDLPRGIFISLIVCTILYVVITLVLTGIVQYNTLAVGDPLAFVFQQIGLTKISWVIGVTAVIAMASVLLVFQMGQPRIWMSMSRDGLLPKAFAKVHPKYKTPSFATIVTGFVVGVPLFFMNMNDLTDLTSIGTLFAFVLVCGGILLIDKKEFETGKKHFTVPYVNGKFIVPLFFIIGSVLVYQLNPVGLDDFIHGKKLKDRETFVEGFTNQELVSLKLAANKDSLNAMLDAIPSQNLDKVLRALPIPQDKIFLSGWDANKHYIPLWCFLILCLVLVFYTWVRNYSLIPVLGLVSCFYLMTELGYTNWLRFVIWLLVGLVIYFFYGYGNSKLGKEKVSEN
ncbi:MAG: amino acid permease [Bacteroidetes bacterium]|nr:amino acid permease [Bacteroidota bacterium]